jgi:hypothetical protein
MTTHTYKYKTIAFVKRSLKNTATMPGAAAATLPTGTITMCRHQPLLTVAIPGTSIWMALD